MAGSATDVVVAAESALGNGAEFAIGSAVASAVGVGGASELATDAGGAAGSAIGVGGVAESVICGVAGPMLVVGDSVIVDVAVAASAGGGAAVALVASVVKVAPVVTGRRSATIGRSGPSWWAAQQVVVR